MSIAFLFFIVIALFAGAGLGLSFYAHGQCIASCYDEMASMERRRGLWTMAALVCLVVMSASAGALVYPITEKILGGL